jgi:adhesin transport system membrane fusion protein
MQSLSGAVLQKAHTTSKIVLLIIFFTFFWFVLWASLAEIDEITRGEGKVIPSSHIKVLQNLEGGIVQDILIREGHKVKKGQPLLKIDNQKFISEFEEIRSKLDTLEAKEARLYAEANQKRFGVKKSLFNRIPDLIRQEHSLYRSNQLKVENENNVLKEQLSQKINELEEARVRKKHYEESTKLIYNQLRIVEPMVRQGIETEVELLKLEREANELQEKYNTVNISIPRLRSVISEYRNKIRNVKLEFIAKAKEEYNKVIGEKNSLLKKLSGSKDQVTRTLIKSPVTGVIKTIHVNTIGGVIKPGMDLIEIVPDDETLLVEAKIKPADIAFLYPGQSALVKVSAYDFSIYGGLSGKVSHISADTIKDKKENEFYLVRIKTDRKSLKGKQGEDLEIITGMTVTVDILTGKKTVMDYLLKPILKAKGTALSER